jgi:hypothetical protein
MTMANEPGHIEFTGSFEAIEAAAADCRRRLEKVVGSELSELGAYDFLRVAIARLHGKISYLPESVDGLGVDGSLVVSPGAKQFWVFLPRTAIPAQTTFTMAHEIGHLVLHYPLANPINETATFARYGISKEERQANRFAAALLMPRDGFKAIWAETGKDSLATAVRFGVMPVDVELRAESLGV